MINKMTVNALYLGGNYAECILLSLSTVLLKLMTQYSVKVTLLLYILAFVIFFLNENNENK